MIDSRMIVMIHKTYNLHFLQTITRLPKIDSLDSLAYQTIYKNGKKKSIKTSLSTEL